MTRIIRKMWRRCKKHKIITAIILFAYMSLQFILFDVTGELNRTSQYERDYIASQANEEANLRIKSQDKKIWEWLPCLDIEEGVSIMIQPFYSYISKSEIQPVLYVPVVIREELPFCLLDGELPQNGQMAAVGSYYSNFFQVDEHGNKYLRIENRDYKIVGIIGNKGSDFQESRIVVPYDSLSVEQKTRIMENGRITLNVRSNSVPLQPVVQKLYEQIVEYDETAYVEVSSIIYPQINQQADWADFSYQLGLYILCVLLIALIAVYRIKNRMPELAVRKILGQSVGSIALIILVENLLELMTSFGLYFAVHSIWCLNMSRSVFPMTVSDVCKNVIIGIGYFGITLVVQTTISVLIVSRSYPAKLLSVKGGMGI